jgi:hypothetical protein
MRPPHLREWQHPFRLCDQCKIAIVEPDAGEIGGPVRMSGSPQATERAVPRPFLCGRVVFKIAHEMMEEPSEGEAGGGSSLKEGEQTVSAGAAVVGSLRSETHS